MTDADRVISAAAIRDTVIPTSMLEGLTIQPPGPPTALVFPGMFTVHRGGRVTVEPDVDLDSMSIVFWAWIRATAPSLVPEKPS